MFALYTFRLKWNGIIWCNAAIDVGPIGCFTFMWLFLRSIDIVCKWTPKPSYCNKLWIICTYLATVRSARLLNENEEIIVIISMRNVSPNCVVSFVTYDIAHFVDIVKISCILTMQEVTSTIFVFIINLGWTKVLQQLAGAIQSKSI